MFLIDLRVLLNYDQPSINPFKMRHWVYFFAAAFFCVTVYGCTLVEQESDEGRETLYQVSTLEALLEGSYDGQSTFAALKQHGDFGVGTLEALDGEVIMLDRQAYQVDAQGVAHLINDTAKTPFAVTTFFEADTSWTFDVASEDSVNCAGLQTYIDGHLSAFDIAHAIEVEGTFDFLLTRSVPRQQKPYEGLADVLVNQVTFDLSDITGSMVGFRLPDYMAGANVAGYHFHFIAGDRTTGGHVLECRPRQVTIRVDHTDQWHVALPGTE
jgi:acetolactate decarboxylase